MSRLYVRIYLHTLAAVVRGEPDWNALPADTPAHIRLLLKRCLDMALALVGLAGVLLVAKPSSALLDSLSLVGVAASLLAAFAFVSIREMSDTEPVYRIVFYFSLFSALVSAIPLTWAWQPLDLRELALLGVIGLLATTSQMVMSKAYSLAPPGIIGPFAYLAIVFSGLIAWLAWEETPDASSLIGAGMIFSASLLSISRKPRGPAST